MDASVAVAWSLPDEESAWSTAVLDQVSTKGAIAPVFFKFEFANAMAMATRRNRIDEVTRDALLMDVSDLHIDFDLECLNSVWETIPALSAKHGLSIYDATYLELAKRKKR